MSNPANAAFAVPAPQVPALPIVGTDAMFPVGRIFCIGRNYAEHAREMGHDPDREPPFFFLKPVSAVVPVPGPGPTALPYPPNTSDYHFEAELVVSLARGGANIAEDVALLGVFGVAVGLDMTRRDRQGEAKKLGRPWDIGKGADASAPIGPMTLLKDWPLENLNSARISLNIDGVQKQSAPLSDMIWSISEQIAILSQSFVLQPGDIIFTGTPAGVGAVTKGQTMTARVDGLTPITLNVV